MKNNDCGSFPPFYSAEKVMIVWAQCNTHVITLKMVSSARR